MPALMRLALLVTLLLNHKKILPKPENGGIIQKTSGSVAQLVRARAF